MRAPSCREHAIGPLAGVVQCQMGDSAASHGDNRTPRGRDPTLLKRCLDVARRTAQGMIKTSNGLGGPQMRKSAHRDLPDAPLAGHDLRALSDHAERLGYRTLARRHRPPTTRGAPQRIELRGDPDGHPRTGIACSVRARTSDGPSELEGKRGRPAPPGNRAPRRRFHQAGAVVVADARALGHRRRVGRLVGVSADIAYGGGTSR